MQPLLNYKITSNSNSLLLITDQNDQLLFSIDNNGELFVGNLTQSIQSAIKSNLNGYRIISNEKNLLLLVDANENEILSVGLDGKLFLRGMSQSIQDALSNIVLVDIEKPIVKTFEFSDAKYAYVPEYMQRLSRVMTTGLQCSPVPLFSSQQSFSINSSWVNDISVEVTQSANRIPIAGYQPGYAEDIGVVHPQIWSFEQTVAGYKYWLGLNPYTNGNENIELPFIYGSNDPELKEWELIPTFPQPFEADPVFEDGSYRGHLSDSGFCYDPKTGI